MLLSSFLENNFFQQILCICAAFKSPNLPKIELAQNIGKLLLQNVSMENDTDILMQVSQKLIVLCLFLQFDVLLILIYY